MCTTVTQVCLTPWVGMTTMAQHNKVFFKKGWLNMVGGCCGSTPPHSKAIREMTVNYTPRKLPDVGRPKVWLSVLEYLVVKDVHNQHGMPFLNVGERCNLSGLIKFKKLMMAGDFGSAMVWLSTWKGYADAASFGGLNLRIDKKSKLTFDVS
jgi:hypothetical protein